jgi:hypothetical protein
VYSVLEFVDNENFPQETIRNIPGRRGSCQRKGCGILHGLRPSPPAKGPKRADDPVKAAEEIVEEIS